MAQTLEQIILEFEAKGIRTVQKEVDTLTGKIQKLQNAGGGSAPGWKPLAGVSAVSGRSGATAVAASFRPGASSSISGLYTNPASSLQASMGGVSRGASLLMNGANAGAQSMGLQTLMSAGSALLSNPIFTALATAAAAATAALMGMVDAVKEMWRSAVSFAKEVLDIKSLTGGSSRDAAGIAGRFHAAGLSPAIAERSVLRLEQAGRSSKGMLAFQSLGINPRGKEGTALLNDTFAALSRMPDGIRKVRIETDLWGAKLAIAQQGVMRLTAAQDAMITANAAALNPRYLDAITRAQGSLNVLGDTILSRLIIPLMGRLAPAIEMVADKISLAVAWVDKLNDLSGGLLWKGLEGVAVALVGFASVFVVPMAAVASLFLIGVGYFVSGIGLLLTGLKSLIDWIGDKLHQDHENVDKQFDAAQRALNAQQRHLRAAERSAEALDDIRGTIGGGPQLRHVWTEMQIEKQVAAMLAPGGGGML